MKIDVIEGIVIRETNYSESSKILNVLTKDRGLIGVMSKGCRNMKNKLRGVSRKLIYGSFHIYYKENGLSTLIIFIRRRIYICGITYKNIDFIYLYNSLFYFAVSIFLNIINGLLYTIYTYINIILAI